MKKPFLDQYQRLAVANSNGHPYMASLALHKILRDISKALRVDKAVNWLNRKLS